MVFFPVHPHPNPLPQCGRGRSAGMQGRLQYPYCRLSYLSPIHGEFSHHMNDQSPSPHELPPLLGESPAFRDMLAHVSRVAPLDRPVLVVGERGTGKELVAARINYLSPRWAKPFVKLNCAALAESLLDSELFGHEAGAFTGAVRRRLSRFEVADGGTLFLDEIANASLAVQEKILRVIEYGSFERVGGNAEQQVDVRIVGATKDRKSVV